MRLRPRLRLRPLVLVLLATCSTTACAAGDESEAQAPAKSAKPHLSAPTAPGSCVATSGATRHSIEGTPTWARFCPGRQGHTIPAEVPSDALTTHLDLLSGLVEVDDESPVPGQCRPSLGRNYKVQIGYPDGSVAQIGGRTDPECLGRLAADGALVRGPDGLGVYGLLMTAFGQQYADQFEDATIATPLVCPDDPRKPDSVDVDGASASLTTGWHLGERKPMLMPLPAVRGIHCTWPFGDDDTAPEVEELTTFEAERVRIGLHAISGGMVDCAGRAAPTYTAVVEDRTGTRRAVTIVESECSTIIRSNDGYGLGFTWLDR